MVVVLRLLLGLDKSGRSGGGSDLLAAGSDSQMGKEPRILHEQANGAFTQGELHGFGDHTA